jgi:competence protein ComEC
MILAWTCAAFIAGVALGRVLLIPMAPLAVLACVLGALALTRRRSVLMAPLVVLVALCLGLARSPHTGAPSSHELAYYRSMVIQAQGTIDAEPDIRDTGANYEADIASVSVHGKTMRVSGALWIHTSRAVQLDYGDRVTVTGRLIGPQYSPFSSATAEVRFPRVLNAGPTNTGLLGWVVPLRQHLEDGINRWLPEPEAALLIAITLGARSASLGDLAPALISTGLIHLIAISGIKVALVAGTVNQIVRRLGNRLFALLASLTVLAGYVLVTGATVSGLRSAFMWGLIFLAAYLGRNTVAIVSLSFAAAVLLALDPTLISNIGFLLSTVGTISIVVFTPPLLRGLERLPAVLRPSPFPEALATTLAAQIGTVPIVIFGFHVVSASGPVANMLVLPLLPVLIALGFMLGACANITLVAAPVAGLVYPLLHFIVRLAEQLATLHADMPSGPLSPTITSGYYIGLICLGLAVLRRANWAPQMSWHGTRREVAVTVVAACVLLSSSLAFARSDASPRLYWLGSGNAMMLRSQGSTALIAGSGQPQALLTRLGAVIPSRDRTIDLIVSTDPRASSVTAYGDVLQHYAVSSVLDVGAQYPDGTYARWRTLIHDRHISAYSLRTGAVADVGGVRIEALAPDGACAVAQDCAGILRLRVKGRTVVLVDSAGVREQRESVFRNVSLRADILVCPLKACDAAFISAVAPEAVFAPSRPAGVTRWRRLPATSTTVVAP